MTEAMIRRNQARRKMEQAKPGSKAWREAEEDLNFWQGRVAMEPAPWHRDGPGPRTGRQS